MNLSRKHHVTLEAIFSNPVPTSLEGKRIEALFGAVRAQAVEGRGSRVRFVHGKTVGTFHRPHPAKEAKAYQVKDARAFLESIGVTPDSSSS